MITKNGTAISSLSQWKVSARPKREYHWSPGRSAYEVAREWLDIEQPALPPAISDLLASSSTFGTVNKWTAEPEARVRFDELGGEPRNTDLLVKATDQHGDFILAIEAKADEPFGSRVAQTLANARKRLIVNHKSRGVERIDSLVQSLLGEAAAGHESISSLRYQLLTATAGAIAAARDAKVNRVVMLVQEFRTSKTKDSKHIANANDLNTFIHRLSKGAVSGCAAGQIVGPFVIPGAPMFETVSQLFIGKVVHDQRAITADDAVVAAMSALGGVRSIAEVKDWIATNVDGKWIDIKTTMADMTSPPSPSSKYSPERQVLQRVAPGQYRLRSESTR